MPEKPRIIDCTEHFTNSNQMLAASLMTYETSLEEQIASNPMLDMDTVPHSSLGVSTVLIPRAGTTDFCLFKTTDTNIGEQNFALLSTQWSTLPVALDALPPALSMVSIDSLWAQHIMGKELDQEQVYYLCQPGRTSILQRLSWELGKTGLPELKGMKQIVLYQKEHRELMTGNLIPGYLHELLHHPSGSEAHQCHPDEQDQAVQPDQE